MLYLWSVVTLYSHLLRALNHCVVHFKGDIQVGEVMVSCMEGIQLFNWLIMLLWF